MKNGDARLQVPDFIEPKDFLPVEVNRPPYLHRYDLFSPKLSRRLTLFSWNTVLLWTMIESHPAIKTFCERPGFVHVHGDWRVADFWVQREGRSEFLVLEHSPLQNLVGVAPRLESDLGLRARTVVDTEFETHATWIRNWQQIWSMAWEGTMLPATFNRHSHPAFGIAVWLTLQRRPHTNFHVSHQELRRRFRTALEDSLASAITLARGMNAHGIYLFEPRLLLPIIFDSARSQRFANRNP
ncbi:hypothetical protein [Paraburkholderia megapolitana]|uniref:hypothetical protein n=1 Tax=Paraburkholderia megapolitana TaxID=420953 RepID=UPI0038BC7D2D